MEKIALSIDTELLETNHNKYSATDTAEKEKEGLRTLLEILEKHDQQITFFVVANMCNDHIGILEEIEQRGHEIASHTLNHRILTELDQEEIRKEVRVSKDKLESSLDVDVDGFRAPLMKSNETVFEELEEAGYKYDSSMIPSLRIPGWYGGDDVGQKPFKKGSLVEFPLSVNPFFKLPISGFFTRFLGCNYLLWSIRELHKRDIVPVLYFHPFEMISFKNKDNWRQRIGSGKYLLDIIGELSKNYQLTSLRELSNVEDYPESI